MAAEAELAAALPDLPRDADGPVFREPWEGQAFTASEWAAALGREIKRAQAAGDPDTGAMYYRHWLNALERLVAEKNLAGDDTLARYRAAWARAAARTPHGAPITLAEGDFA
jgi:nitrile hydratase accessory protein